MSTLCNVFWRFDLVLISHGEIRPSPLRTFRFPKCQLDECCSLDPSAALMSGLFTPSNVTTAAFCLDLSFHSPMRVLRGFFQWENRYAAFWQQTLSVRDDQ